MSRKFNSIYDVCCLAIKFTDTEEKNLGTTNWQSDHYVAFTEVYLFPISLEIVETLQTTLANNLFFFEDRKNNFVLFYLSHFCGRKGSNRDNQCLGETIPIILQKTMDRSRK